MTGTDRRLLSALGLSGSAALATVAFGVATTKIIAVGAGPAGIALMGIYRYLAALVSRFLLLGLDTTLVQRISTADDEEVRSRTVGAAFLALLGQAAVIGLVALALASPLSRWLFVGEPEPSQLVEVRVVLAMAYANLVLQVMTALLGGRVEVGKAARVSVVAAVVTLLSIHPLLRLGTLGLALNVGSGSVAGAALAAYYVIRAYGLSWTAVPIAARLRELAGAISRSAFLILHPLVMMSAILAVQALVHERRSLEGLGAYNAAMTLLDTAVMVLMASARTFHLPALGRLAGPGEKAAFVNRALRLHLVLTSAAALLVIAGGRVLVPFLFSGRFGDAVAILPAFGVALVPQAFVWSYAMFYLHHARYRLFFLLDLFWATAYVAGSALALARTDSLEAAAWAYAGSYALSAVAYAGAAVWAFGPTMLEGVNLRLGAAALLGATAACLLHDFQSLLVDLGVLALGLAGLLWVTRGSLGARRAGEPA